MKHSDKQITSASSQFLEACRGYNEGTVPYDELIGTTVKKGFTNVIDAFHVVNQGEVGVRFFTDDRKGRIKGITVTDELLALKDTYQWQNLPNEVEARWRLVETAWSLNVSPHTLQIEHNPNVETLSVADSLRRITITSSRDALNGYQKSRCFYCFRNISVHARSDDLADVDHFFPYTLKAAGLRSVDSVWNLVLACRECNRGPKGKFARIPELRYLKRLDMRNSYLVNSHHPLRETIINQTGATDAERQRFLQGFYNEAVTSVLTRWRPKEEFEAVF